ncbi:hypothetical protein OIO90_004589 [Microbotryomycetes sp. JL221]|nr:hypothetical protein OIO90_004589 [Microbotryomycetes sp. JL221]
MADLPLTISLDGPLSSTSRQRRTAGKNGDEGVAGSVPLTMPAFLLHDASAARARSRLNSNQKRADNEPRSIARDRNDAVAGLKGGRRRKRRTENAQLAGNPHVQRPLKRDYLSPGVPAVDSTVFAPPPASFPRSLYVPAVPSPKTRHAPSEAGQFTMSARGTRRTLRSMLGDERGEGGRTEELLMLMEDEIRSWLMQSGAIPDGYYHSSTQGRVLDDTPVEDWIVPPTEPTPNAASSLANGNGVPADVDQATLPPTLTELTRSPSTLVWLMPSPHARFLLHVLARYYSLQSFSRPLSPLQPTIRVTHISRPHMVQTRAVHAGMGDAGFDTPPGTDWSDMGHTTGLDTSESEMTPSEFASDADSLAGETDDDWQDVSKGADLPRTRGPQRHGRSLALPSRLEDVPSSDAGSDTGRGEDDDEFDDSDAGGINELADSIADLKTADKPTESESLVTDGSHATLVANRTASAATPPAFVPSPFTDVTTTDSPAGATTPQPLRSRLPRASFPPSTRPKTRTSRADSFDSSRSRSPIRVTVDDKMLRTTGNAVGWKMPEQSLIDYLFE